MRPYYLGGPVSLEIAREWSQHEKATAGIIWMIAEKEGGRPTKMREWRIKIGERNQSKRGGESFLGKTTRDQSPVHSVASYVSNYCAFVHHASTPTHSLRPFSPMLSTSKKNTSLVSLCSGYFSPWVPPERYISIVYLLIKSLHKCLAPSH